MKRISRFGLWAALTVGLCFPATALAQQNGFVSLYGGMLASLSAEVEELDPFFGGGIAWQDGNWRIAGDYLKGEGVSESYGSAAEIDIEDTLYGITVDYIFEPVEESESSYYGLGLGYFHEEVEADIDAGGYSSELDLSASSISIEAILGYKGESYEVFGRLISFPGSENVTLAGIVGIGLTF